MSDLISRAEAVKAIRKCKFESVMPSDWYRGMECAQDIVEELPSAEAEPKWNCTANFVAEQLDRLRKMTDEEKWNFFREFFGMGDAVHGEWEHWGSPFSDESEVIDTIVCSVCGARFIEPKDEPKGEYNYCPNCGARMKGGA